MHISHTTQTAACRALVFLAAMAAWGCGGGGDATTGPGGGGGGGNGGGTTPPVVSSIAIAPSAVTLVGIGATATLQATASSSSGVISNPTLTWSSSAPGVATVTGSGSSAHVAAVALGTATITATSGSVSQTVAVTVAAPTFTVTLALSGAGQGRVTSTPSGIDCVRAASATTGSCTALFTQGTAVTLLATAPAGHGFDGWAGACTGTGACAVTIDAARLVQGSFRVLPPPVASVTLTPSTVTIPLNGSATVVATVRDAAGNILTDRPLTWTSSNDTVASVSAAGLVTARRVGGPVTIRATAEGIAGTAQVSVQSPFVTAVSLALGSLHSCAVDELGVLLCWGDNSRGQLGRGTTSGELGAAPVSSTLRFITASAGQYHACGRATDGLTYCFGNNQYGQLGDGTTTNRLLPTATAGNYLFQRLAAGGDGSCGVLASGTLYCWGYNGGGFLGTASSANAVTAPSPAGGGLAFAGIVMDDRSTCGVDLLGAGYCWGLGNEGRNGNGSLNHLSAPGLVQGGRRYQSIATSAYGHTCAIDQAGQGWCWGSNAVGQMGFGAINSRNLSAIQLLTDQRFTAITVGERHSCALTAQGEAWCWGFNQSGQVGDGTATNRSTPVRVQTALRFTQLIARDDHTCGIATVTNVVYCWGNNRFGQLGTGSSSGNSTPVAVPRP